MIAVSNDFKTAMKKPIKELSAYIKLDENNKITSADDLISFKISCDASLCKTGMRKLEARCIGEHNLLDQWLHVGFGVKLPDGTFEYLDYGSFLVTEITTVKDTGITTIIGYDKMISSMKEYTPLTVDYPINLYDYTKQLCSACGLTLGNDSFSTHGSWQVEEELWENISGITYRDIFVQIAQVTASTCMIGTDDKVYFKKINNTEETLTYANMKTLKLEPKYGEINSVVLSRTPQEDNIYMQDDVSIEENGLTEFKIENNEIIDKDRDSAMTPIYNALHGISYYPFETTTEGLGWYEIADNFDIINDTNDTFNTTLFNFSIQIDGGIKETLKTVANTKTQTQYQYATTIAKRLKNTEIIVDKQGQYIEQIVSDTKENSEQISQVKQDIDSIQNLFQITGGSNDIKNSTGLFESNYWTNSESGEFERGYDVNLVGSTVSNSKIGIKNGKTQTNSDNIVNLMVGELRTLSFKLTNQANTTTKIKLIGNDTLVDETISEECELKEFNYQYYPDTPNLTLIIESISDHDGWTYVSDLMSNAGDKRNWEPARDEIVGTVLKLSQLGLTVYCTGSDIATLMTAQGFQVREFRNNELYEVITEFTKDGINTKDIFCTKIEVDKAITEVISVDGNDTVIMYLRSDN